MLNLNRVHLNGLRATEAVGRLGGLRAAAGEIGITIGAVSQRIQKTEKQLGRALFERQPKGLTPTPLGEGVVRYLTAGFSELAAAVALADRTREDRLTVSVAPVLAGKWLVWRLHGFNTENPDIQVRVDATMSLVDPNLSDVDVCIRVGRGNWPGMASEKLLDQRVFPVCSPSLAKQLQEPADLAAVPIIRDFEAMFGWDTWLAPVGHDVAMLGKGPVFSDASLCLDAAIAGQGVFLAWDTLACDALLAGRLVAPFPGRRQTGISYWFVTAQNTPSTRGMQAFRKWLKTELSASVAV